MQVLEADKLGAYLIEVFDQVAATQQYGDQIVLFSQPFPDIQRQDGRAGAARLMANQDDRVFFRCEAGGIWGELQRCG